MGIDSDKDCAHEFVFGKSRFLQFSENAVRKMREAIDSEDVDRGMGRLQEEERQGGLAGRAVGDVNAAPLTGRL
jgi:hypothetical protein